MQTRMDMEMRPIVTMSEQMYTPMQTNIVMG